MTTYKSGIFGLLYYAFFGLAALFSGLLRPEFNWDIVPYVGCVQSLRTADPHELHSSTYAELRSVAGTRHYTAPDDPFDTPSRKAVRSDPDEFVKILSFYRFHAAYILLIAALAHAGMDVVFATYFVSAVSVLVSFFILYAIARRYLGNGYFYLVPFLALALGTVVVARLSTPDGLALMFLLACACLFLGNNRTLLFLLPFLVTVRIDLMIIVLLTCLSLTFGGRMKKWPVAVSFMSSLVIYFFVRWYFAFPGWKRVFYFQFIDKSPVIPGENVGIHEYIRALLGGFWGIMNNPVLLAFACIAVLAVIIVAPRLKDNPDLLLKEPPVQLMLIALLSAAVHMLLFPLAATRYFTGPALILAVSLLVLISRESKNGFSDPPGRHPVVEH